MDRKRKRAAFEESAMSKHLMQTVLPRLAQPLYWHLEKFQSGEMSEIQFNELFETVLEEQHVWLSRRIPAPRAAVLLHAGILILTRPGLQAEAEESGLPFELVEHRALMDAAADVARRYRLKPARVANRIAALVARFES